MTRSLLQFRPFVSKTSEGRVRMPRKEEPVVQKQLSTVYTDICEIYGSLVSYFQVFVCCSLRTSATSALKQP